MKGERKKGFGSVRDEQQHMKSFEKKKKRKRRRRKA